MGSQQLAKKQLANIGFDESLDVEDEWDLFK